MRSVDPQDTAEPGPFGAALELDELLLRDCLGILGAKQGVASTVAKPSDSGLIVQPDDDHLAIELPRVFIVVGEGDGRPIGDDRRHGVATHPDAAVFLLSFEQLLLRRRRGGRLEPGGLEISQVLSGPRAAGLFVFQQLEARS